MAARERKKKPTATLVTRKRPMQFSSLPIAWLIAFVETADHKKRAAAAATLGVTPSAVTKHIDKLGCWYGGGPCRMLMQSNVHPPVLTPDGDDFLPKAREILALLREALPAPVKVEPAPPEAPMREIRVPPAPRVLEQ